MEFNYKARDQKGIQVAGIVEAPNTEQAILALQRRGLLLLSLEASEKKVLDKDLNLFFSRPSRKDVIIFTRQLATLIDADIPLLESLKILEDQTDKDSFKKIISKVSSGIEGGSALSVSLSEHDEVFDDFYVNLVKVGEVSGKLHDALLYMADYLERSAAISAKIRGALFYPAFVLSALLIVVTIMMTSVIPQLLSIVKDSGITELPLTTKILIASTNFVNNYIFVIVFFVVFGVVILSQYIKTEGGKYNWDRFKLNMPQFGKIVRNLYVARMAETLATLIKSGVPILDSLSITSKVVGNEVYKNILLEAEEKVRGGGTISEALAKHIEVPTLMSSMIATGEKTGRIEPMLGNVLKFYETEAEESIKNISQLIEPILILILGIGVAILVSAVLLPIYSIVGSGA